MSAINVGEMEQNSVDKLVKVSEPVVTMYRTELDGVLKGIIRGPNITYAFRKDSLPSLFLDFGFLLGNQLYVYSKQSKHASGQQTEVRTDGW